MAEIKARPLTRKDMARSRKTWQEQEWEWKNNRDPRQKPTLPKLRFMEGPGPADSKWDPQTPKAHR
jgi:hypothetical protein